MDHETYVRMLPLFVAEAEECLNDLDEGILALSRDNSDKAALQSMARAAHTIAGNAAAVGYKAMLPESQIIELIVASAGIRGIAQTRMQALIQARNALRRLLAEMPVEQYAARAS